MLGAETAASRRALHYALVYQLLSMDGKGRCLDNIIVERFWRSLKYEMIFLHEFTTMAVGRHSNSDQFAVSPPMKFGPRDARDIF